jgi:hypothetical protein
MEYFSGSAAEMKAGECGSGALGESKTYVGRETEGMDRLRRDLITMAAVADEVMLLRNRMK